MKNARYFSDKIHIQSELKKDEEYLKLTESEREEIFREIMQDEKESGINEFYNK